jgi:uncharacterized membrane protein (Fun14 family)
MSIPPEIAWLIPIFVPFIIGLLVGVVIRAALKLVIFIVALIIVLVATGVLSLTFTDLYDKAMEHLPNLIKSEHSWLNVLPYSSVTFLIGLALGLLLG